jgi:hypothetical protein
LADTILLRRSELSHMASSTFSTTEANRTFVAVDQP